MTSVPPRYMLEKQSRRPETKAKHFRLRHDSEVVLVGSTAGRLLTSATRFNGADGDSYEMVPARKVAPKVWHLRSTGDSDLASFILSRGGRGSTVIRDHRTNLELELRPSDSPFRDMAKALVLADTTRLQLVLGGDVVGLFASGDPRIRLGFQAAGRLWGQLRGSAEFYAAGAYIQVSETWLPDAPLALAMLLFRDQVIDDVRSG